jgi:hypothetical protein
MATITEEKAMVTVCKGDWDYFAGFYELAELTEESALAVATEAAQYEMAELHCVWVEAAGETFHFDREELRGE